MNKKPVKGRWRSPDYQVSSQEETKDREKKKAVVKYHGKSQLDRQTCRGCGGRIEGRENRLYCNKEQKADGKSIVLCQCTDFKIPFMRI